MPTKLWVQALGLLAGQDEDLLRSRCELVDDADFFPNRVEPSRVESSLQYGAYFLPPVEIEALSTTQSQPIFASCEFAPILRVTLRRMRGNCRSMKPLFVSLAAAFVAAVLAVPASFAADEKSASKEVAVIKTTMGEMVVEFWPDVAPKTVENFSNT